MLSQAGPEPVAAQGTSLGVGVGLEVAVGVAVAVAVAVTVAVGVGVGVGPCIVYVPVKGWLVLHSRDWAAIAPAAMLNVTLPPKLKCNVNRAVMLLLTTWTLVTLPPTTPVIIRSLVVTEVGSIA
jgi:hypothetical protein